MYSPTGKKRKFITFKKRNIEGYHFSSFSSAREKGAKLPIFKFFKGKNIYKTLLYSSLGFIIFIALLFLWYSRDLPNPYKLNRLPVAQSTKIMDRNGELLYEIHGEENRTLVKFEDIPDNIKKATVALEDEDFYKHSGFNLRGILRAFLYDITHRGPTQGGSTITQQYIKNALLTSEKRFSRKIKELILSLEIEKIYSKNEILGMYLNEIPYGNNAYGIEAASQTYFGKDAKDLTLAEAALLASLPQAPTYYNPYGSNSDILMKRKDFTLDKIAKLKLITKEETENAKKEEIKFVAKDYGIKAPHFVMYIKELLAEEYGEETLQKGGLIVTTSLDWEKQKIAEEVITKQKDYMASRGTKNASLISLDPKTGEILAMVGSVDYFDQENDGNVNVSIRLRQPGSSIKPVIYAAAFEKGYSPATMLMDVETDFGSNYKPQNYDKKFRGPVSIRKAIGNSLNIPAVKTLQLVGVRNATDLAQKMGLKSLNDPDRYGLSLVLGGGEVKLLEMVQAYAVFADGGLRHDIVPILKIEDGKGKALFEYKKEENKGARVLSEDITSIVSNVLSDDSARAEVFGTGGVLTLPGRMVAAKTGTTDEYRDAWTLGYTPSLVTGVWAGNNDNTSMDHAAGSMIAAPIWNGFMKQALAGTPAESFKTTAGIEKITVDALTGMLPLENIPEELKEELKTKEEIFLKNNAPKIQDNVHKILKIIKPTNIEGLDEKNIQYIIAGDDCPLGMVQYKVFYEYHSINPNWKNWEDAVIKWAKDNGYNNIPEEKENCDEFVEKNKPKVTILSPKNNQTVENSLSVSISYQAPQIASKAEYFLSEEKIAEVTETPFNLENFSLPKGTSNNIKLKIILTDQVGLTATDTVSINIKGDGSGGEITISLTEENYNQNQILFRVSVNVPLPDEITKIEFFVNNQNAGIMQKESELYSYIWNIDQNPGNFTFYAKAYSANGKIKQSNSILKTTE